MRADDVIRLWQIDLCEDEIEEFIDDDEEESEYED